MLCSEKDAVTDGDGLPQENVCVGECTRCAMEERLEAIMSRMSHHGSSQQSCQQAACTSLPTDSSTHCTHKLNVSDYGSETQSCQSPVTSECCHNVVVFGLCNVPVFFSVVSWNRV